MPKRPTPVSPDFRLTVLPHRNERTLAPTTLVLLETAQSFAAFRYELSVEETRTAESITYRILGLKAPSLSLPSAGPAQYRREYDDLSGVTSFSVIGLNGAKGACTLRISPSSVQIVRPPTGGTLIVQTEPRMETR